MPFDGTEQHNCKFPPGSVITVWWDHKLVSTAVMTLTRGFWNGVW